MLAVATLVVSIAARVVSILVPFPSVYALATALVAGVLLLAPDNHARSAENDLRPNVVFVLIDDLGWTDAGCCGSRFYQTPNLDQLAREGMRFTDAYAACCVCS